MSRSFPAIYENGAFRPLKPVPCQEREQVLLTVLRRDSPEKGLVDEQFHKYCESEADDSVTLDEVRQALAKIPGSLSDDVRAERDER